MEEQQPVQLRLDQLNHGARMSHYLGKPQVFDLEDAVEDHITNTTRPKQVKRFKRVTSSLIKGKFVELR